MVDHVILAHRNAIEVAAVAAASSSSVSVGNGSKTWTVPSGTKFYKDAIVTAVKATDPAIWMRGAITAFNPSTNQVTVNVTSNSGSSSHNTWILTLDKWRDGDWPAPLPLTQFDDQRLWQIARSADSDPESTRFIVDLGAATTLQLLMLLQSNLEVDAGARVVLFNVDPETGLETIEYATGKFAFWPPDVVFGSLPWGELPWSGRSPALNISRASPTHFTREMLTLESLSSHTIGTGVRILVTDGPTTGFELGMPVDVTSDASWRNGFLGVVQEIEPNKLHVRVTEPQGAGTFGDWTIRALKPGGARTSYQARFAAVQLFNQGHASGYVQAGGVFLGPYTQPTRNVENGLRIGLIPNSTVARTPGGHKIGQRRRQLKRFTFSIGYLDRDEAFGTFFELQRSKDLLDPFIVMLDPADSINAMRWSMYGTLEDLQEVEHIVGRYHRISMVMVES